MKTRYALRYTVAAALAVAACLFQGPTVARGQVVGSVSPGGNAGANDALAQMASAGQSTGEVNYAVPLASVADGDLSLSLSARYASAGYRLQDKGGVLGLGWFFDAGASLTREVRGIPDDAVGGAWNGGIDLSTQAKRDEALAMLRDAEYDVMHYRVGGSAGAFYCTGTTIYQVPLTDNRIEVIRYGTSAAVGFKITTANGTVYTFGGVRVVGSTTTLMMNFGTHPTQKEWALGANSFPVYKKRYPTEYLLAEITTYNNSKLTFNYTGTGTHVESRRIPMAMVTGSYSAASNISRNPIQVAGSDFTLNLESIIGARDGMRVDLTYRAGIGSGAPSLLDNVKVNVGEFGQNVRFIYTSFQTYDRNEPYTPPYDAEYDPQPDPVPVNTSFPALERIIPYGKWDARGYDEMPHYRFEYNEMTGLMYPHPQKSPIAGLSIVSHDYLGFASKESNYSGLPLKSIPGGTIGHGNREPVPAESSKTLLKAVVNPYNGRTEITYEPHDQSLTQPNVATASSACTLANSNATCNGTASQPTGASVSFVADAGTLAGASLVIETGSDINGASFTAILTVTQVATGASDTASFSIGPALTTSPVAVEAFLRDLFGMGTGSFAYGTYQASVRINQDGPATLPGGEPAYIYATARFTLTQYTTNKPVPGHRVKSISFNDNNGNVSTRQYTYRQVAPGYEARSSGSTLGTPNFYTTFPGTSAVSFSSESFGSLTFASGSHILYAVVTEETVGLGVAVTKYNVPFSASNTARLVDIEPVPLRQPGEGLVVSRQQATAAGAQPFYTEIHEYGVAQVVPATTPQSTRIVGGSAGQARSFAYRHANARAERLTKTTVTEDGRSTVTTYAYHADLNEAAPVTVATSLPDGTTSAQQIDYTRDYATNSTMRQKLIDFNAVAIPYRTSSQRNGQFLSEQRTEFAFWNAGNPASPLSSYAANGPIAPRYIWQKGYFTDATGAATERSMTLTVKEVMEVFPDGSPRRSIGIEDGHFTTLVVQDGLVTSSAYGGAVTTNTYQFRLLKTAKAPDGTVTTYAYDDFNRVRLVTRCDNSSVEYQYNRIQPSRGGFYSTATVSRSGANAARQHVWRTFDGAGRVIQEVSNGTNIETPDGGANGVGYVWSRTDYDAYGRKKVEYAPVTRLGAFVDFGHRLFAAPAGTRSVTYGYEPGPRSRLSTVTNSGFTSTYTYGYNTAAVTVVGPRTSYAPGTLASVRVYDQNNYSKESLSDSWGNTVVTREYASGGSTAYNEVLYGYDVKNQLIAVVPSVSSLGNPARHYRYTYDRFGRKLTSKTPGRAEDIYTYNTRGQVETASTPYTREGAGNANRVFRFSYTSFGQPWTTWLTSSATPGGSSSPDKVEEFEYYTTAGQSGYNQVKVHRAVMLDNAAEIIVDTYTPGTCGRAGTSEQTGLVYGGATLRALVTQGYDTDNRPSATTSSFTLPGRTVKTVATANYLPDQSVGSLGYTLEVSATATNLVNKYNGTAYEVVATAYGELKTRRVDRASDASAWLQEIDHAYDAVGRLTTINQPLYRDGVTDGTSTLVSTTNQINAPVVAGGLTPGSPQADRDLFYERISYGARTGGTAEGASAAHAGLITETMTQTLGRRPVVEAYAYDAQLRLVRADAQEVAHAGVTAITLYTNSRHTRSGYAYDELNRLTALQRFGYSAGPTNSQDILFDNLGYYYRDDNARMAPTTVYDFARQARGHSNGNTSSGATTYTYNAAGDVLTDANKGLTYTYNALGLVSRVQRGTAELTYRYSGDGTLRASTETNASGVVTSRLFHLAGNRYDAVNAETLVQTPYGACLIDGNLAAKNIGYHADHLGNVILAYADLDGNGVINPVTEVLEESRYYPYGFKQAPYTKQLTSLPFAYNGAESQDGFGLHLTTYRTMSLEVALWGQTDPKAEWDYASSPYSSMQGNPISFADPDGDFIFAPIKGMIKGVGNVLAQWAAGDLNGFGSVVEAYATGYIGGFVGEIARPFVTIGRALTPGVGPINTLVNEISKPVKLGATIASFGRGFIQGLTTTDGDGLRAGDWSRLENAARITLGEAYSDNRRSFGAQVFQIASRGTRESIQTNLGAIYSHTRNAIGSGDLNTRLMRGYTFTERYDIDRLGNQRRGVSLGGYINISSGGPDRGFTLDNEPDRVPGVVPGLLRHEYGHTFDSQRWGSLYMLGVGLPSALNANWTERRADTFGINYFLRFP